MDWELEIKDSEFISEKKTPTDENMTANTLLYKNLFRRA